MVNIPNLGVPGSMFESHEEYTGYLARQQATTGFQFRVKIGQASTDTILEVEDDRIRWPGVVSLGNFGMWPLLWVRIQNQTS